ncbi:MAG TPA: MopE-related protein [Polyangiaceae bacterium]|nr:MopE-related protein [Polyangiaceae bacterium]
MTLLASFRGLAPCALFLGLVSASATAHAAFDCSSSNPVDWPPSSRPYFMLAIDTSGSMSSCTNPATTWPSTSCPSTATKNSCGLEPTRLNDAKCAMTKTISAFAGEVNFGLATYAPRLTGCNNGAVVDSCTAANGNCPGAGTSSEIYGGNGCSLDNPTNGDTCGNTPDCGGTNANIYTGATVNGVVLPGDNWVNGGNILVDLLQDPTWAPATTPATNVTTLLQYFDGRTDQSREIFAGGFTPLEGILRTIHQYYAAGWSSSWANGNYCPTGGPTIDHPSPLDPNNDRVCRSLNVILVTDGDESCGGNPGNAATALNQVGAVIQGVRIPIKTYVIGFAGATKANLDTIAASGGTTSSYTANNEVQLSQALAGIIGGAIKPEVCDNTDNNCNGCVDEGWAKYCNRNKTPSATPTNNNQCCSAARATCLTNFKNSITAAKPQGDKFWLPCWDPTTDNVNPDQKWLCTDPGEICDNKDNDCETQVDPTKAASFATNVADEQQLKCGTPAHCPLTETCDGTDQNCDGVTDNAAGSGVPFSVCPNSCVPTGELCNGCDDDCDGIADNGVPDVPCGFTPPANCAGVSKCVAKPVSGPGACIPGVTKPGTNQYGACSATGSTETCNGVDDNCNGVVDDNPTGEGAACTPNPGDPTIGACKAGTRVCENGAFVCVGYIGPSQEVCDGIDNDCDGKIDAADPDMPPLGQVCGSTTGQCAKGTTACVGGAVVCTGGTSPTPEVCNGKDDDCNGVNDDSLTDVPGNTACWNNPVSGTCTTSCTAAGVTWCPPAGGTCTGLGTLTGDCKLGQLQCFSGAWTCRDSVIPTPEQCDNHDNDCNGQVDDGLGSPYGDVCGRTVPGTPCLAGITKCVNGAQICDGQVPGTAEICNGKDDDCDGVVDNGIVIGASCPATYDHAQYPGPDRSGGECQPGTTDCDVATGQQICKGGKGPSPEVCDGLDNDCDGQIDESGTPPDGINGTADPNDPTKVIGATCGVAVGQCKPGLYACVAGQVVCTGASGAQPEVCDCIDNDCDGKIDEDDPPPPGGQPLCATGKTCVQRTNGGSCQCAPACVGREFPCPAGLVCESDVVLSGTDTPADKRVCLRPDTCGDCATKTVTGTGGAILCAPTGTDPNTGDRYPVCECKGTSCHEPCFEPPTCPSGQSCAPRTGTCQPTNNCNFFGCPQGQACSVNHTCVPNKCATDPCPAGQVCKPTADFSDRSCVGSCADVTCTKPGESCVDGECKPTGCGVACTGTDVCHAATGDAGTGTCGPSLCTPTTCGGGEYCDPATGRCGQDPCEGVICPTDQVCKAGECQKPSPPPVTTDGGSTTDGAAPGAGGSSGAGGGSGTGAKPPVVIPPKSAFGLATGGGGCACSVPDSGNRNATGGALVAFAALAAFGARRRSRRDAKGGAR